MWPYWYYEVLVLYGQHLALNHLISSRQINLIKLENQLDFPTSNEESVFRKLHLHVFHGDDFFSKFEFKNGKYDDMKLDDRNLSLVNNYCLKMALEAKSKSNKQLLKLLVEQIIKKI